MSDSTQKDDELPLFVPSNELEQAIHQGDYAATLACLQRLSPAERRASRESLSNMSDLIDRSYWAAWRYARQWADGEKGTPEQYRALQAALVVCGEPKDFVGRVLHTCSLDVARFKGLCEQFDLDFAAWCAALQQLVETALEESPRAIDTVQNLIGAGLIKRPTSEAYAVGLIAIPREILWRGRSNIEELFSADPGLVQALLQLFEVEGTGEHNLAACDKYAKRPEWEWKNIFLKAIADGFYTRELLLEKTLGTLERDWPQFRAGWFSRFHEALAPTVDEMAPLASRYLGLCQSRIAPTVSFALSVLKALYAAKKVQGAALLSALEPVFYSSIKGQVDAALKLAEAVVKREPSLAQAASSVVQFGLVHEAADLQKKIIDRLVAWGVNEPTRESLAAHLENVASANRPALAKLIGVASEPAALESMAPPAFEGSGAIDPLDPSRALVPLEDSDELVERIAFVLENSEAIDETERVMEALVRLSPLSDELRAKCAPVLKRSRKILARGESSKFAYQVSRLVVFVLTGEREAEFTRPKSRHAQNDALYDLFIERRIEDLIVQSAKGWALTPLSVATHRGGFIDPKVFAQRQAAYQALCAKDLKSEELLREAARAQHRLWPCVLASTAGGYAWRIETWQTQSYDNTQTHTHHRMKIKNGAGEELESGYWSEVAAVRYHAAIEPGALERFFAQGCKSVANNLDWWGVEWENRGYIEMLLEPTTLMTAEQPMAVFLLALAIAGKEPGQTALAVDALVRSCQEGRLDVAALGVQLRALMATPIVLAKRYVKSLQAAVRADARLSPVVFDLLCEMVVADVEKPPKDLAALLELLLELALSSQQCLPESTRELLAAMTLSGKGRTVQKSLLALPVR